MDRAKKGILIKNADLIDGTGQSPRKNARLLIEGDRVAAIDPGKPIDTIDESDWVVIDAQGKTVLPGLIDCHNHMGIVSEKITEHDIIPLELNTLIAARDVESVLMAGFTTARCMGGRGNIEISIRDGIDKGLIHGPRLLVAGRYITCTGGLMDYYPSWISSPSGLGVVADGPVEMLKAVRNMIKVGADLIKIDGSGATTSPYCPPDKPTLSMEEMKAVVEEAKRHNRRVAIHAETAQSVKDAVRAGVNTVEHGIFLDAESARLMKAAGVYFIPTIGITYSRYRSGEKEKMPDFMRQRVTHVYERHAQSMELAADIGVKMAIGTDVGVAIPAGKNAYELSCFVQHGFSPMEAIVAATKTASEALGIDAEVGTLEVGKKADVIVIDGNPLDDIRILQDTSRIALIVKQGEIIKNALVPAPHRPQ